MLAFFKDPRAVALLLAASLTILSNMIISPALPGLQANFPENEHAALVTRLLVTAPSLLVAIVAPFAGMAADRFGRRNQLLAGALLFSIAGCAGMVLPTLEMILASRLVLGLAVCMVMTSQAALIGDYFAGPARGRFMGLQMSAVNFSGFAFIAFAGWLAGLSPRLPFAIYVLGAVYLPFLWFAVKEPVRSPAPQQASPDPQRVSGLEGQRGWAVTLGVIVALCWLSFVLFYMIPTQMPYYLSSIGFTDPSAPAQVLSMVTIAGGFAALAFGPVRMRLGAGFTPGLGYVLMAAGFFVLDLAHDMLPISVGALCIGAGFGLTMPTFFALALDAVPARRRGMASGAITTSIFLGQFFSPIFSTPLVAAWSYEITFAIASVLFAIMALLTVAKFHPWRGAPLPV